MSADEGPAGLGEFAFIAALAKAAGQAPEALGLADDGAVLKLPDGRTLVLAADMMQAGVHTMADAPPAQIACKTLRSNLSDLAAMGAVPAFYLSTICWPGAPAPEVAHSLAEVLAEEQQRFGIALIGGDTVVGRGPLTLSMTVLGWAEGALLRRTGAQPGDEVWLSGTLGDGWLGLQMAQDKMRGLGTDEAAWLLRRYEYPEPRLALGQALAGLAHCALDVSDGLLADAAHLAKAGGCRLSLKVEALPLSAPARRWLATQDDRRAARRALMRGGDDYELLFTAAPAARPAIEALGQKLGLALSALGTVSTGQGVWLQEAGEPAQKVKAGGFTHF